MKMNILSRIVFMLFIPTSVSCQSQRLDNISNTPKTGIYGNISVVFKDVDSVVGVYEFYGNWDPKIHSFLSTTVFIFKGKKENRFYDIVAGWPGNQKLKGKVFINEDSIRIELNDQPDGYNNFDFTNPGYIAKLDTIKPWLDIGVVKNNKCKLYSTIVDSKSVGFILKDEIVKIISREKKFVKIEYLKPGSFRSKIYNVSADDIVELGKLLF